MIRLLFGLIALGLSSLALTAAELSSQELDRAKDHLTKTRDALLAATANLSEQQWTFKPAPTRWSVGETTEHIAAAEAFLLELVRDKVMPAPARAEAVDLHEIDTFVLTAIPDRSRKAQAPEPLIPGNRFGSQAETINGFKANREKTVAFLTSTKDLRDHAIDSPLGRQLDAYQWILFISAHCERHTKQIEEVKADPGFPQR